MLNHGQLSVMTVAKGNLWSPALQPNDDDDDDEFTDEKFGYVYAHETLTLPSIF